MILRSSYEVALDSLPLDVLSQRSDARYSIKYTHSTAEQGTRVLIAVLFAGAICLAVALGEVESRQQAVGAICLAIVVCVVASLYPTRTIDCSRRCIECGWSLFNRIPIGSSRLNVGDGDMLFIRQSDHDGEYRHNVLYEVTIIRSGRMRRNVTLVAVVTVKCDPMPKLEAFTELVSRLLGMYSERTRHVQEQRQRKTAFNEDVPMDREEPECDSNEV